MRAITCLAFCLVILLAGCSHDYKNDALQILHEDEIQSPTLEQLEPGLTAHLKEGCQRYKCTPKQYIAGARRLQSAMRLADPTATLSTAASLIPADRLSLDEAVDSIISGFKALR